MFSPAATVLGTFPITVNIKDNNLYNPKSVNYVFTVTVKEPLLWDDSNSTTNDSIVFDVNTTKPGKTSKY